MSVLDASDLLAERTEAVNGNIDDRAEEAD